MTDPAPPHAQAAFINALREEGTRDEACNRLQKVWNERCALAAEVERLEKLSEEAVAKCVTLHSRAVSAEAKVREQALDYLALDGQAIEALAEVERLREALADFVAMGESYGWDESLTGRQLLMRTARALTEKEKPHA